MTSKIVKKNGADYVKSALFLQLLHCLNKIDNNVETLIKQKATTLRGCRYT